MGPKIRKKLQQYSRKISRFFRVANIDMRMGILYAVFQIFRYSNSYLCIIYDG